MKYAAQIKVSGNAEELFECFTPELKKDSRSDFSLKKDGQSLVFDIYAKDAAALRATFNSIAKLLVVNEKMESLK